MKQIALALLFALAAWGQSPPTVTVADTIQLGINSLLYNGRIVLTAPDRAYNSVPLVYDPVTIQVTNGAFSVTLVPSDVTTPNTVYTATYYSNSGAKVKTENWLVPSSPSTLKLLDVVVRGPVSPPNYAKLPVAQLGGAGAALDYCVTWDGTKAIWAECSAGSSSGKIALNVKDYGAVGNGTTDDTTAIQSAINAAALSGGRVYIPAGKYRTTATLNIQTQISIEGEQSTTRLFPSPGSSPIGALIYYEGTGTAIDVKNNGGAGTAGSTFVPRVRLSHFRVAAKNSAAIGIRLYNVQESELDDIGIGDTYDGPDGVFAVGLVCAGCDTHTRIHDGVITSSPVLIDFKYDGVTSLNSSAAIYNMNLFAASTAAIRIGQVSGIEIGPNNYIEEAKVAVLIDNAGVPSLGSAIDGLKFHHNHVFNGGSSTLDARLLKVQHGDDAKGIIIHNARFTDNLVNSDTGSAYLMEVLYGSTSRTQDAADITVQNNDLWGGTTSAVYSDNASKVTWRFGYNDAKNHFWGVSNAAVPYFSGLGIVRNAPAVPSYGSGAPTSTPQAISDTYVDTTNHKSYTAECTTSSACWLASQDGGGSFTSNEGITAVGTTIGVDFSVVPRWSTGTGAPTYSAPAGSEVYRDSVTGYVYMANGTTSWPRLFLSDATILATSMPLPGTSSLGGVMRNAGTTGQFVTGINSSGQLTYDTPAGGGSGSTTGLYSGTIDFGSIPDGGCADATFTATGLTTGRTLAVSVPAAWNTGLIATAIASAADTAKIRACNFSGASVDPASGTFKVRDMDALGYITGTATIDFSSIPDGACSASTITVTGAAAGDSVAAGWPSGLASGLVGMMFVSATDTVAVRLCNWSGAAVDPASGSFKAAITR